MTRDASLDANLVGALTGVRNRALVVGLVAAAACVAGVYFDLKHFLPAYLVALLLWLGIALGALAVVMLHHVTGGAWGMAVRRILEAAASTLPLLALLFVPLLLQAGKIYPWADRKWMLSDPHLHHKADFLSVQAVQLRAVGYFAIWIVLALWLNRRPAGGHADVSQHRRSIHVSAVGLGLWVLTVTFASIDWVMSLDPKWTSSMFGVLFLAGQGVSALAVGIIALSWLKEFRPWKNLFELGRLHDLGNLLLGFVLFWSYVSFMQYLIIWSANLPEEATWYLDRTRGGWQAFGMALMGLHFLVPLMLLLSRQVKRDPRLVVRVAVLLVFMRFIDLTWLVVPAFGRDLRALNVWNLVAPVAVGGLWIAMFMWRLQARAAAPVFEDLVTEESPDVARHADA